MRVIISKLIIIGVLLLSSCTTHDGNAVYQISTSESDALCIPLIEWNVCGAFTLEEDSLLKDSFLEDPHHFTDLQATDTTHIYKYYGYYHPLCNQLDLKEVFDVQPDDTTTGSGFAGSGSGAGSTSKGSSCVITSAIVFFTTGL